jgi:uncharacterized NAD(P)/FAD-binding protein YdhS
MLSEQPYDVAVIGAGASGTLVASQFSRHAAPGARLALIGSGSRPGRGVAYETPYLANVLNVPAGNMSAFPDDSLHFVRWLSTCLPGSGATTFAPRSAYGDYLAEILEETLRSKTVQLVDATAISLNRSHGVWSVQLQDGSSIQARSIVLAIGNALIPAAPLDVSSIAPHYHGNPWGADTLKGLTSTAPVLLIGTGLTMVDVVLSLRESGHAGPIHAVSRHGRVYQHHTPYTQRPLLETGDNFRTPLTALRWIRSAILQMKDTDGDWRAVIDSLRPHSAQIWQAWSLRQRASFLRHARNLWDIHRHRMAPRVSTQLNRLLSDDILHIHAGRLVKAETDGTRALISIRSPQTADTFVIPVERVINCTGPTRNFATTGIPLIASLREQGWLTPDPLRLGIETDNDGRLIDVDGSAAKSLFTLGPLRIPSLFESIAIPEIRVQASELAQLLVSEAIDNSGKTFT